MYIILSKHTEFRGVEIDMNCPSTAKCTCSLQYAMYRLIAFCNIFFKDRNNTSKSR